MKLIVGLGNPEKQYEGSRHNVGFAVLDDFAAKNGLKWQEKTKFKAMIAEVETDEKALLVKPTTYYNLVGESVRALADFYKVAPENILIVHDDHVLPLGTLRTREQGSDAGNNGIKSINSHIGPNTRRLRIGTDGEHRSNTGDTAHVLGPFSTTERQKMQELQPKIEAIIDDFIGNNFFKTTHR